MSVLQERLSCVDDSYTLCLNHNLSGLTSSVLNYLTFSQ